MRPTRLLLVPVAAALLLSLGAAKKPKDAAKPADEKKEWNVEAPPGNWRTITIDATETTWSSVDVSPDGKTVVFDALGDLWTVPIEGGEAKRLTSGISWDFQPRFSPDGKRIAFISDRKGGDNLWIVDADGTKPRAVTDEKEHIVHCPWWSPDGDFLVAKKDFVSTRSIPAGEIWLFHAEGGGGLQLTERPNGPRDQKTMADPAFSPDGRYVYYSQDATPGLVWQYDKDSTGQIFVIRRLDRITGETDVVAGGPGGAIRPVPSPDGRTLAYVKRIPGLTSAIYLKDLASGHERPVYTELDRDLQETSGAHGNAPSFAWMPGGQELVFWSGGKIRRLDVERRESREIPVRIRGEFRVNETLRFPVDVAPETLRVRMPRWVTQAPVGPRVVFQALGRLWVTDSEGAAPRRLTRQEEHIESHPAFSRDGKWVVYSTWNDESLGSIRMVNVLTGDARVVVSEPGPYVEPRFSPDGSMIVYRKIAGGYLLSPVGGAEPGIYLTTVSGYKPMRISRSGFDAHFGAANDRVYFSDVVEETKLVLKSVNLQGHDPFTHLKGNEITEYRVSPDGRWIAFTEDWNAFVAPFAPTGKTVEIAGSAKSIPVRQVSKRSGSNLHWSGDAKSLRWAHASTLYTRELKDAFAVLEGSPETLPEPVETGLDLAFEVPADDPAGTIALVGGRVVTMRDAEKTREVIEDGVVLVRGNSIEAVGPREKVPVPFSAVTIDVSGKTVLPGLVDAHAHGAMAMDGLMPEQNWQHFSNLAFGVTTIHDPSNDTESIFAAAELQRAGKMIAPRIFSTGTILYGANHPAYRAKVESLDDARFHVRRLKEAGAISVKSYQHPRRDQRQMVIEAGRELGIMVVPEGGAKFEHNMTEIVDGHTGIEHAIPLARAYDDVKQLWSKTTVGYTPTFVVAYGGLSGERFWYDRTEVWKNERLMRWSPRSVIEPESIRRQTAPDDHYNHFEVARFAKELRDLGVTVHIGAHGQREGLAAHWELWMMAQGGFSPWEALRAGTIDGARYLGLDGWVGSIEAGKLADLFVVDGNPLEDLRRSEFVTHTMVNGRLYEAATMKQLAPDVVERKAFYFEKEGGDTIHPATAAWLEALRERLGWAH